MDQDQVFNTQTLVIWVNHVTLLLKMSFVIAGNYDFQLIVKKERSFLELVIKANAATFARSIIGEIHVKSEAVAKNVIVTTTLIEM